MPIPLACTCGRSMRIKDELAGRKVRCPDCAAVLPVPEPGAEPAPEEEEERPRPPRPKPVARRDAEGEAADELLADDPDHEHSRRTSVQAEPPAPPRRRSLNDADAERPEKPKKPKKRRPVRRDDDERRGPRIAFEPGWFGSMNAGVAGGVLMIIIAVVWFVVGLMNNYIFFYPPVLLVIGLGAIFKGLAGGD